MRSDIVLRTHVSRFPSSLWYTVTFIFVVQLLLMRFVPLSLVYDYRIEYNVLKDNIADIDPVLDLIAQTISRHGIIEYYILLGDSIAYSGPGGPRESISYYMSQISEGNGGPIIFNLAFPAAQTGDVYTMLCKLREKGISTDNVIVNLTYGGFAKRTPNPPIVYWLGRELERLDPETYREISPQVEASTENQDNRSKFDVFLDRWVYSYIPVLKYKDFIRIAFLNALGVPPEVEGDRRPWYKKPYLKAALEGPEYAREFTDEPFDISDANPNVYFLRRIAELGRGKRYFFFMSPINSELMAEKIKKPGFRENMKQIDHFSGDLPVHYLNLSDAIEPDYFSDHLHLTPEGYKKLATMLWNWVNTVDSGANISGVS